MLAALVVLLRSLGSICRGHRAVALENVALRQHDDDRQTELVDRRDPMRQAPSATRRPLWDQSSTLMPPAMNIPSKPVLFTLWSD